MLYKGRKQTQMFAPVNQVLRMPLHGQQVLVLTVLGALQHTVRRKRHGAQPAAGIIGVYGLMMPAIHFQPRGANKLRQA